VGLDGVVDELTWPVVSRDGFAVSVKVHFCARTRCGIVAAFAVDDEGFELWVGWCGCG